jgi:hypothetical protein
MAVIHRTTLTPTKLELIAPWLVTRPWYAGGPGGPRLAKAGGFRLDDPEGEVGVEFMAVTDAAPADPVAYHVPLTYRGAPLEGAGGVLLGTAEHGVLGRRWIYDGAHDPVLVAALVALLHGGAEPQAQSVTGTPDPSVAVRRPAAGAVPTVTAAAVDDGPDGTDLLVRTAGDGGGAGRLTVRIARVLRPGAGSALPAGASADVTAGWRLPDGTQARGTFARVLGHLT